MPTSPWVCQGYAVCMQVFVDRKREAPAVFKHGAHYLMLTSGCQGWDPSAAEVFVARYLLVFLC